MNICDIIVGNVPSFEKFYLHIISVERVGVRFRKRAWIQAREIVQKQLSVLVRQKLRRQPVIAGRIGKMIDLGSADGVPLSRAHIVNYIQP